MTANTFYF